MTLGGVGNLPPVSKGRAQVATELRSASVHNRLIASSGECALVTLVDDETCCHAKLSESHSGAEFRLGADAKRNNALIWPRPRRPSKAIDDDQESIRVASDNRRRQLDEEAVRDAQVLDAVQQHEAVGDRSPDNSIDLIGDRTSIDSTSLTGQPRVPSAWITRHAGPAIPRFISTLNDRSPSLTSATTPTSWPSTGSFADRNSTFAPVALCSNASPRQHQHRDRWVMTCRHPRSKGRRALGLHFRSWTCVLPGSLLLPPPSRR